MAGLQIRVGQCKRTYCAAKHGCGLAKLQIFVSSDVLVQELNWTSYSRLLTPNCTNIYFETPGKAEVSKWGSIARQEPEAVHGFLTAPSQTCRTVRVSLYRCMLRRPILTPRPAAAAETDIPAQHAKCQGRTAKAYAKTCVKPKGIRNKPTTNTLRRRYINKASLILL